MNRSHYCQWVWTHVKKWILASSYLGHLIKKKWNYTKVHGTHNIKIIALKNTEQAGIYLKHKIKLTKTSPMYIVCNAKWSVIKKLYWFYSVIRWELLTYKIIIKSRFILQHRSRFWRLFWKRHSWTLDKDIWDITLGQKFLSNPSYLTQAVMRGLFIGCIWPHAYGRRVTSMFSQSDIIMWYCISAYSGTSESLF